MYTKKKLIKSIRDWEVDAGESFKDYFLHDNVKALSWSFWLLGKGFTEHALQLINKIDEGKTYFDQEELFDIYPEYTYDEVGNETWSDENYDKNVEIWAEFLIATKSYQKRVISFFKDNK
jgi:hypothetical protein